MTDRLTALIGHMRGMLVARLIGFNEAKQELYCRICRYRDPLGPDGHKLHDDDCELLAVLNEADEVEDELEAALAAAPASSPPRWKRICSA